MIKPMTVMYSPKIMSDKLYMVMIPNRNKGNKAVAPYFFDTKKEAEGFIAKQLAKTTYWWEKE